MYSGMRRPACTGGRPGSRSLTHPAAACMVSGVVSLPRSGPCCPNPEIRTTTSRGFRRCRTSASRPQPSRVPGARLSTSRSAPAISSCTASMFTETAGSAVVADFPAFRYANSPPSDPQARRGSPAGGSTLWTSAPRSANSLVQYGPAICPPISTTRSPAKAPVMQAPRSLWAPCTTGARAHRPRALCRSARSRRTAHPRRSFR